MINFSDIPTIRNWKPNTPQEASILIGRRVVRGPDWAWYDQDCADGKQQIGQITAFNPSTRWFDVRWKGGRLNAYRMGHGHADLIVLSEEEGEGMGKYIDIFDGCVVMFDYGTGAARLVKIIEARHGKDCALGVLVDDKGKEIGTHAEYHKQRMSWAGVPRLDPISVALEEALKMMRQGNA